MDERDLFDKAYSELDEHRFDEARESYRKAALGAEPSEIDLQNMGITEAHEAISFLRILSNKYPNSVVILIALADALGRAILYPQAVEVYSLALSKVPRNSKQALSICTKRFVAMCRTTRPDKANIVTEFTNLWMWGNVFEDAILIRKIIVKTLIEYIHHPTSKGIFDKLSEASFLPASVQQLFYHKMEMLKLVDNVNTN
jgi:hypothetical protein